MPAAVAPIDINRGRSGSISVLLIDDSAVARAAMSQMVAASADLTLAATAEGATQAIDWLRHNCVDVVVLDLMMPGRDGIEALPDLLAAGRGARVLVVSSTARAGAEATLRALAAGASDTLAKPEAGQLNQQFGAVLADRIARLGRVTTAAQCDATVRLRPAPVGDVAILGIGASTGGLKALGEFFAALPDEFAAPILVTQHLPASFMPYFAEQLEAMAGRRALVARDGHAVIGGTIVVAPGDGHLCVERSGSDTVVRISHEPAESRCCPSVDPMFASMARAFGNEAVGVVLTGMGRDGSLGAAQLARTHAAVFVQDMASSAVWGMPGTVARAGHASAIAAPGEIARLVAARALA